MPFYFFLDDCITRKMNGRIISERIIGKNHLPQSPTAALLLKYVYKTIALKIIRTTSLMNRSIRVAMLYCSLAFSRVIVVK